MFCRVLEGEFPGVQCDALWKASPAAIFFVTNSRYTQSFQLNAYLVFATGFELHFKERQQARMLDDFVL